MPNRDRDSAAAERLVQVSFQILEPDRQPDAKVGDPHAGAFLGVDAAVCRRARVTGERLLIPEIVGNINQAKRVQHPERLVLAACDREAEQRSAVRHLPFRKLMLQMAG